MLSVLRPLRKLASAGLLTIVLATGADAQTPEEAIQRDLNHYANIVAAYHVDRRCRVLASSQRAEYHSHIQVIQRAFVVLGLEPESLLRIAERAINSSAKGPYKDCNAKTADAVKQVAVLAMTMGKELANWLAANDRGNPGRRGLSQSKAPAKKK